MYFVYELEVPGSALHEERQGYHAETLEHANDRIAQHLQRVFGGVRDDAVARFLGAWPTKEAYERSPDRPPAWRPILRARPQPPRAARRSA